MYSALAYSLKGPGNTWRRYVPHSIIPRSHSPVSSPLLPFPPWFPSSRNQRPSRSPTLLHSRGMSGCLLLKTKPSPTDVLPSPRTRLPLGEDTLQISVEPRSNKPFGSTQDSMPSQIKKANLRRQYLTDLRMGLLLGQIRANTDDDLPQVHSSPHPQQVATMRPDV